MLTMFDKALAPIIVTVIMAILGAVGIMGDMTVATAVPLGVAAIAVYFVPNKK